MTDDQLLRNEWHAVARADELYDRKLVTATLFEEDIVLWRSAEALHAWADRCPHRGARLSLGSFVAPSRLRCAYHGWQFGPDGRCARMPAVPAATPPAKAAVRSFAVREKHGLIWACLGQPAGEIPDLIGLDDDYELVVTGPYEVETSGPRAIENFLDLSHFAFVHDGLLGAEPHTEIPDYEVAVGEDGIIVRNVQAWQPRSNSMSEGGAYVAYTYRVPRPHLAYLTKEPGAAGGKPAEIIMIAVTPRTEVSIRAWFVMGLTYAKGRPHRRFVDFQDVIFSQDKPVLESQRPQRLPLDPAAELHQRCDRTSIAYRRWLASLGMTYGVIPAPGPGLPKQPAAARTD